MNLHLRGFDGMRAIACLLVLFHHLLQRMNTQSPVRLISDYGEVGVSIFFVLSGALLAFPFWQAYLMGEQRPSLKRYLALRAGRIVPAFYLVLTVTYIVGWLFADMQSPLLRYAAALTFIAPYHYVTFFPNDLNGPLWSIGLEVSCYLLLPLLFLLVWRLGKSAWWKAGAVVLLSVIGLQLLNPLVLDWFMTDDYLKGWQFGVVGGAKFWLPYWNVVSFFGQFLVGSTLAWLIVVIQMKSKKPEHWSADLLAIGALAAAVWSVSYLMEWSGNPSWWTHQPYAAPMFAIFIAAALLALNFSRWLWMVFDNVIFREVAKLSFGIYLWHYLIMECLRLFYAPWYVYNGLNDWSMWTGYSLVVVLLSTAIAALSFYFFEKPILTKVRIRFQK